MSDLKAKWIALDERYGKLQEKERELKMEMGQFDDDIKELVKETTGAGEGQINLARIVRKALEA